MPEFLSPHAELQARPPAERLLRHTVRPGWGTGLWVAEESTRRRVRFEDGVLRTFKKGWYHLLVEPELDLDDAEDLAERLSSEHDRSSSLEADDAPPPRMSWSEQIQVFRALYPGGFQGEAYTQAHRRPQGGKAKRTHLSVAVQRAQELLSRSRLEEHAEESPAQTLAAVAKLLKGSSLLRSSSAVSRLESLDDATALPVLEALTELLHDSAEPMDERFGRWLKSLRAVGMDPDWSTATAVGTLYDPEAWVSVRHNAFELQSRELAPRLRIRKRPSRAGLRRAAELAGTAHNRLVADGLQPRDLLDVRRFMWETLRPKGVQTLKSLK